MPLLSYIKTEKFINNEFNHTIMTEAHFKILGLTVPSEQYTYHDDGYVKSISDTTIEVSDLYGLDNSNYDKVETNLLSANALQ